MSSLDPTRRTELESAVRDHREGRLRQAVAAYENLLRQAPEDADLTQLLGVALGQLGNHEAGARFLARSLELEPDRPTVLLNLAHALRTLGREEEALRCCDRALVLDPSLAGGYRTRGAALAALGRRQDALANYGQAVRLAPADAGAHADLGVALDAVGRTGDALVCFERAIELNPSLAAAHHNHAMLTARLGNHERALQSFDRALALQPHHAALHNNRANTLKELGRLPEALRSYTLALAIEPGNMETLHNRAVVYSLLGRHAEALRDYDELLARRGEHAPDLIGRGAALVALHRNAEALKPLQRATEQLPHDAEAHVQYGVALLRLKRYEEALASFDRALAIRSDSPEVLNNRGVALVELDQLEEALLTFQSAVALSAVSADAYTNLGLVYRSLSRYYEAMASFQQTLARKPADPAASFALAFVHLTVGEFKEGWPLYEARFQEPSLAVPTRHFDVPRWDGRELLPGKTLLVHAEQGLGDAIHFCRYLPLLASKGVNIVFEVTPSLKALMRSLPGNVQVIGRGERIPSVDYHCPLLSLPLALGTDLATIPADVPYLKAEPERVARWAARLQAVPGLRVGICWQGNPVVEQLIWARGRSMPLAELAPLAQISGVSLVCLQKGPGSEQLQEVSFCDRVLDLGSELDQGPDAFLDTAAAMASLDLVISTDTSIAHLAGALARPTWIALPAAAEWRWLLERNDSPWYPTMRLFRQRRRRNWPSVVTALVAALRPLAGSAGNRASS
jgi:tetratricopeptide (TPR) repeat protein